MSLSSQTLAETLGLKPVYDEDKDNITLIRIPDNINDVFKNWSKIPEPEILSHIMKIHDEALKTYSYGCVGVYLFLHLYLPSYPIGPTILSRVTQQNQKFLDVGCCFAQDIRYLANAGASPSNLYGTDYQQGFLDCGHDLFKDRDRLEKQFFTADLINGIDEVDAKRGELKGRMDIIHAANFLHLFDLDTQYKVAKNIFYFLSDKPGSLIIGSQTGRVKSGVYTSPRTGEGRPKTIWRHNETSFEKMWKEVAEEVLGEGKVKIDVTAGSLKGIKPTGLEMSGTISMIRHPGDFDDATQLVFSVERM